MKVRKLHRKRNNAPLRMGQQEIRSQRFVRQMAVAEKIIHDDRGLLLVLEAGQPTHGSPSSAILIEATMMLRAKKAVLEGADWLTAAQVASIAGLGEMDAGAQLDKWSRDSVIFALRHNGIDYFPGYALDPDNEHRPYPALKKVLEQFGDSKDGWGFAYWLQSVNSFLGGRRPIDMLANGSNEVIAAAADEVMGVAHA